MVFGSSIDSVPRIHRYYISQIANQSTATNRATSYISKITRNDYSHSRVIVSGIPTDNGNSVIILWKEDLNSKCTLRYRCDFQSESHYVLGQPQLTFSSFRDFCPYHITLKLDNNCTCRCDLPPQALSPYQPNSRLITTVVSTFYELVVKLGESPFLKANFHTTANACCEKVGALHAFFFGPDGELLHHYMDIDADPLSPEVIAELPGKIVASERLSVVDNLLGDGRRVIVYKPPVAAYCVTAVISLQKPLAGDIFEIFGIPFFALCCNFLYQLSMTKEQNLRFGRILSLFMFDNRFSLLEISLTTSRVHTLCSSLGLEKYTTRDELIAYLKQRAIPNFDRLVREVDGTVNEHGGYARHIVQERVGGSARYFCVDVIGCYEGDEKLLFVASEDITAIKMQEGELIASIRDLHRVLKSAEVYHFVVDNGKYILETTALQEALGIPTDQNNLREIICRSDQVKFCRLQPRANVPMRIIDSARTPHWFIVTTDGRQGYTYSIHDITDVRTKLINDQKTKTDIVSLPVFFWEVDAETEAVRSIQFRPTVWDALAVDANTKFFRLIDFISQEKRAEFTAGYQSVRTGDTDHWTGELLMMGFGGGFVWHQLTLTAHGPTIHCMLLNINEQKQMEVAINETRTLRDLLLMSGKIVLWKFFDNRNPLAPIRTFDPADAKVIAMNWVSVETQVHKDYRDLFIGRLRHSLDTEDPIEMDFPLMLDDTEFWVSVRGRSGTTRTLVGVMVDINEYRVAYSELEREKKSAIQANKEKTLFLANMSHEIRTPMNGIFGMLDVLAMQDLSKEQRLLVDSIRSSSFQLMRLLDDTLNLSKIEEGVIETENVIFDILKLFEPTCIANSSRARSNGIRLWVDINPNFPNTVIGDAQLFMQILNNLLSNAMKFTKKGGVTVGFSWVVDNDREMLELVVQDTGIGMSQEQQKFIFERYTQAEASTSRYFGGTGLGLALVQEIARFLGGGVVLESEPDKGTRFTVRLPMESLLWPYSPPFADGRRHIILISIEEESTRRNIAAWLPFHHYEVVEFERPSEIPKAAEGCVVHVVFVEGRRDKWNVIQRAVERLPGDIPVCSICDPGEKSVFRYALVKPVMMHHLLYVVNALRYGHRDILSPALVMPREDATKRVLIVEDNKANQFVMKKILTNLNCKFSVAENGLEAINTLDEDEFDIIFMDCQMPVMDGIEATKQIRRSGKFYATVPIIALTASAVEGDELNCREAGMDGYLAKPVRIQQISDALKKYCS